MPVPFEIRFTRKVSLTEPPRRTLSLSENFYETQMKSYRHQFFLIDRMILLTKLYNFESYEYILSADESINGVAEETKNQFEKRMSRIIQSLNAFLKNNSQKAVDARFHQTARIRLDNEHEGKTLLHLSCASNMKELFSSLIYLKHSIFGSSDSILDLIGNELNLLKLDQDGFTPLVLF
jgi:hypothetical protein